MPELARRAFREALSGRPGPVHLDIPHDVLAAECEFADDEFAIGSARYRPTVRRAPTPRALPPRHACSLRRSGRSSWPAAAS